MGEIVNLHGLSVGLENDLEFVSDLARFRENLLDEKAIRKKYRLANDVWEKLADDDALIRAVEAESTATTDALRRRDADVFALTRGTLRPAAATAVSPS